MAGDLVCFTSERRVCYWNLVRRKSKETNKEHVVQRQTMNLTKNIDHYRPAVYTKNDSCDFFVFSLPYGYYIDDSCFVYRCVRYNGGYLPQNDPIGLFTHELYCNYRKTYTWLFSSYRRRTEGSTSVLLACAL